MILFGAEMGLTVLDSNAEIKRQQDLVSSMGVVTCELYTVVQTPFDYVQ